MWFLYLLVENLILTNLNLEAIGVELDEKKRIKTDKSFSNKCS